MAPGTSQIQVRKEMPLDLENVQDVQRAEWKPSLHELLIMISLSIISLMISLDATIIITSLSTIVTDLNGTATQGLWVGTSYLLTSAVTMPFTAALSDIFGRPVCLLTALAIFTVGTILCCVANTFTILLAGRSIQGIGGGGIMILGLVIFTDIVPLRFRSKYYGIIQGAWAAGTCVGPVIGGALVEKTTWRWVFYIMFPFCFIGFVSIPWLLTLKPRTATMKEKLLRVDWIGGFLFISSCTAFLMAVSWGGAQEPWGSFRTIVPLVIGAVGMVGAMFWEAYGATEPFLPHSLFHCRSSFTAYFGAVVQGLVLFGQLYYIPFYFLSVKGNSPVRTGITLFPVTFALVPASIVVGVIVARVNAFRWAIWTGWTIITLASGLSVAWDVHTSTAFWTTTLVILGIGHGLTLSTQNFASQAICKPREEASAAAMYAFLRSFGMALGVGIGGSIFQNVMKAKLIKLHLPVPIALNSEAYTVILRTLPNGPFKAQVLEAYASGFRGVYIGFCGISALALLVSLFIKHYDMNKVLESEHKLQDHRLSKILQLVGTPSETPTGANTPPAVAERMADSRAESHQEIEKL